MNMRTVRPVLLGITSLLLTVFVLILFPQPGALTILGTAATLFLLVGLILGQTLRPLAALLSADGSRLSSGPAGATLVATLFAGLPAVLASVARADVTGDGWAFVAAVLWYAVPMVAIVVLVFARRGRSGGRGAGDRVVFVACLALSVLLFIGFDHRYTGVLFAGLSGMSYTVNSLWVAAILLVVVRSLPDDHREDLPLRFDRSTWLWAAVALGLITVTIVPAGLATGFLRFEPELPRDASGLVELLGAFLGILLTIALPEELVARAVLQRGVARIAGRWWVGLLVASVLFGAMHWNNAGPDFRLHYIGFASVAGVCYGVAYLKGGLGAAVLAHTAVDWVWALLLKR
jgi:membrane protease YdiL (CAAX protease family)